MMAEQTSNYGLVGYPISHSKSADWFQEFFLDQGIRANYRLFPLPHLGDLENFLNEVRDLDGFNVTIPYKEVIIPYLDEWDEGAKAIGAVNCVAVVGGKRKGYNTDAMAFLKTMEDEENLGDALILGTGGASKAVAYALDQIGISWNMVSRKPHGEHWSYDQISPEMVSQFSMIVNTTPLGSLPLKDQFPPIPFDGLGPHSFLYDLVYNPEETEFMKKGKAVGARVKNGLDMLHLQALYSWRIWSKGQPMV